MATAQEKQSRLRKPFVCRNKTLLRLRAAVRGRSRRGAAGRPARGSTTRAAAPPSADEEPVAADVAQPEVAVPPAPPGFSETALRNIAHEAVRSVNYWAPPEQAHEVLACIVSEYSHFLSNEKWLQRNRKLMERENGLTESYTVGQLLSKQHEADGYNIFVDAEEAVFAFEAERARKENPVELGPKVLSADELQELKESFQAVVDAADVDEPGEVLDADEIVECLQACSVAGEAPAAVFCAEHLRTSNGNAFPESSVDAVFEALKPLLRPTNRREATQLEQPQATTGKKALNSGLGRVLDDLAKSRREAAIAQGGQAAERHEIKTKGEDALRRVGAVLAPLLTQDAEGQKCQRRGVLTKVIVRLCKDSLALSISGELARGIMQELERISVVKARGREISITSSAKAAAEEDLAAVKGGDTLAVLEKLAKEKSKRKQERFEARRKGQAAKRRRT